VSSLGNSFILEYLFMFTNDLSNRLIASLINFYAIFSNQSVSPFVNPLVSIYQARIS
jgi:hypothetical protein